VCKLYGGVMATIQSEIVKLNKVSLGSKSGCLLVNLSCKIEMNQICSCSHLTYQ
jgi:hypothetical protein